MWQQCRAGLMWQQQNHPARLPGSSSLSAPGKHKVATVGDGQEISQRLQEGGARGYARASWLAV